MPLNVPKAYTYTPVSSGETKVISKVAKRSRLNIGGTYFRSIERGQQANLIKIDLVLDLFLGILVYLKSSYQTLY